MKATSEEKRELLISAKERGEKEDDIARWLNISVRCVSRIWKLYKETESIQPKKQPGRKPSLSEEGIRQIREIVKLQPDIILEEIIESLNLPIRKSRLSAVLIGLGLDIKKNVISEGSIERRYPKRACRLD